MQLQRRNDHSTLVVSIFIVERVPTLKARHMKKRISKPTNVLSNDLEHDFGANHMMNTQTLCNPSGDC